MQASKEARYHETDNVYLNINIDNPATNTRLAPAVYDVTKTIPILDDCSQYYCAVERFTIPLSTVPLFIVPHEDGAPTDETPFIIGIALGGTNYSENLIYIRHATDNTHCEYYWSHCYQTFIDMLNTALLKIVQSDAAFVSYVGADFSWRPRFDYSTNTKKISLIYPNTFLNNTSEAAKPVIYMNNALSRWLEGFHTKELGYGNADGRDVEFITAEWSSGNLIWPTGDDAYPTPLATVPDTFIAPERMFVSRQEYVTLQNWTSVRRIALVSPTMPIRKEFVPSGTADASAISISQPVLADFAVVTENPGDNRLVLNFFPQAPVRLIDMITTEPLMKVSLHIYWVDSSERMRPLMLEPGAVANIKLKFVRKSVQKNYWFNE